MKFFTRLWGLFEKIVLAVVGFFLGLFGKKLDEEQQKSFMQFVKFCLVGVSNTAVSLCVYYIFVLIDPDLYIIGNAVGFVASVINAYFWNSKFVFKKEDEKAKTILKTFVTYGINLAIATVCLYVMVDKFNMSEFIAPIVNLVITIPINYVMNKFWVMK